jgi:hypothetical protein
VGFMVSSALVNRLYPNDSDPGIAELPMFAFGAWVCATVLTYVFLIARFRFARRARTLVMYSRFTLICPFVVFVTLLITGGVANSSQPHQNPFEVVLGALNLVLVIAFCWLLAMDVTLLSKPANSSSQ